MPPEDTRPDPDALLIAAAREGKGRLKVFLGAAPGVGKTWETLTAARQLRAEGRDVLVGVKPTAAPKPKHRSATFRCCPPQSVPYRGQIPEEFDVDAALGAPPRPCSWSMNSLTPTLRAAATTSAGKMSPELLEAGIDVWATLNVQHLESLNQPHRPHHRRSSSGNAAGPGAGNGRRDRVHRPEARPSFGTGLTGPHLSPGRGEPRIGRVFPRRQSAALREIGVARGPQRVDQDVRDYMRQKAIAGPWPAGDCVLALVGPDATAGAVVRQAKRLADAPDARRIALHVERSAGSEDARHAWNGRPTWRRRGPAGRPRAIAHHARPWPARAT